MYQPLAQPILAFVVASAILCTSVSCADRAYPPVIEGAVASVYKEIDGVELKLWVFRPDQAEKRPAPALIFFFGGGWRSGSPKQFVPQCQHLAERGMYGIVADYRVASRHGVKAKSCVEDALDALCYVKKHADDLGIDADRIGVGGGSAGGHLAGCLGTIEANHPDAPSLMALYNPAIMLASVESSEEIPTEFQEQFDEMNRRFESKQTELADRFGVSPRELSPFHHAKETSPPTIIFHGTKDKTVPFATAVIFERKLRANKVNAVLKDYDGQGHGFFNREPFQSRTTAELDRFLVKQGWLTDETVIDAPNTTR